MLSNKKYGKLKCIRLIKFWRNEAPQNPLELLTYLQESSFGGFGFDFRDRVGLEEVDGRPERVSENVEKFEENTRSQSLLLSVDLWKTWIQTFWIKAKIQILIKSRLW